jgi:hypothetical protein
MSRLILGHGGQLLAEFNMSKERYTIGRLPDNDIRIDNPSVSGHHALVINILNDSFLEDLSSTNGTYVNGRIVKKHALQHDDVITVGQHTLRYVDSDAEDAALEFASTTVLDPEEAARASTAATTVAMRSFAKDKKAAPTAPPKAKLQILSGRSAGRELDLTKTLTTVGQPGRQVAAITRHADGYYIVHVEGGQTGEFPQVNGNVIGQQALRLRDNDVIQLGGVKMGFFAT